MICYVTFFQATSSSLFDFLLLISMGYSLVSSHLKTLLFLHCIKVALVFSFEVVLVSSFKVALVSGFCLLSLAHLLDHLEKHRWVREGVKKRPYL